MVKFSVYLNRHVFVLTCTKPYPLNSDVAPNYKCKFDEYEGNLPYLLKHHSETHLIENTVMTQSKELKGDPKPEQKKTTNMGQHLNAEQNYSRQHSIFFHVSDVIRLDIACELSA